MKIELLGGLYELGKHSASSSQISERWITTGMEYLNINKLSELFEPLVKQCIYYMCLVLA